MWLIDSSRAEIEKFILKNPEWVVIIWWATATGKSSLSVELSTFFDIEIISSDSRQVFKYMDIWTDKISKEIREKIKHHQIDLLDPDKTFTAWEWKKSTEKLIPQIQKKWKLPIIVWWTWLYIDSIYRNFNMPNVIPDPYLREKLYKMEENQPWILFDRLQNIDPEEAMKLHPNSIRYIVRALEIYEKLWKTKTETAKQLPVKWPLLMIWLRREKEATNMRINKRVKEMLKWWLIDEVNSLIKMWYSDSLQSMQWIWYKEVVWYIRGEYNIDKLEELIKRNTHRYAKKQRTWFRRYILDSKVAPKDNVKYLLNTL
jgi:tRNA dimethylallyltransferase